LSVRNRQTVLGGDIFKGILTAVCGHGSVAGVAEMRGNEAYSMVATFLDSVLSDTDCTVGYDSACQLAPMLTKSRDLLLRGKPVGFSLELIDRILAKTLVVDNLHAAGHIEPCAQLYGAFGADGAGLGRFEANETLNSFLGKAAPRLRQMSLRRRSVELSHLLVSWSYKANGNIVANTFATMKRAGQMAVKGACELFSQGAPPLNVLREWGDLLVRRAATATSRAAQQASRKRARAQVAGAPQLSQECSGSVGQAISTPDRASAVQPNNGGQMATYFGESTGVVHDMLALLRQAHSAFLKAVALHVFIRGSESGERLNVTAYQDARVKFAQISADIISLVGTAVTCVSGSGVEVLGSVSVLKHWRRALLFLGSTLTPATVVALCRAYATGRINISVATTVAAQERRAALLARGVASDMLPWLPMLQLADSLESCVNLEVDSPGANACWGSDRYAPWGGVFRVIAADLCGVPLQEWPTIPQMRSSATLCGAIIDIALRCGLHPVWLPMLRWATRENTVQEAGIACGADTLLHDILQEAEGRSMGNFGFQGPLCRWLLSQTPDCYCGSPVYLPGHLVADSAAMVESLSRIFRGSEQFIQARETLASASLVTDSARTKQTEALVCLSTRSRQLQTASVPCRDYSRGHTAFLQQLVRGHMASSEALFASTQTIHARWAASIPRGSDHSVRLTDWAKICTQHSVPDQAGALQGVE